MTTTKLQTKGKRLKEEIQDLLEEPLCVGQNAIEGAVAGAIIVGSVTAVVGAAGGTFVVPGVGTIVLGAGTGILGGAVGGVGGALIAGFSALEKCQ